MYNPCSFNYFFGHSERSLNRFLNISRLPFVLHDKPRLGYPPFVIPRAQALLHPPGIHGEFSTLLPLHGGAALCAAWRFAQSRASARKLVSPPPGPLHVLQISIRGYPFSPSSLLSVSRWIFQPAIVTS